VYLNGNYVPAVEAVISVDDRGFLFADAVYEVTPAYGGRCLLLDRHLGRLQRNLDLLRIRCDAAALANLHGELLERNGLASAEFSIVYVQITRGTAPRGHAFPDPAVAPTVYAFARAVTRPTPAAWAAGGRAVTVPDQRWARPEIKTTLLLPNVLAQQVAVDAGVSDAILVRDGMALEAPSANLFAVMDGVLTTAPASNYILHGITRSFVLELAGELELPTAERSFTVDELKRAEEVFLSSTVLEIRPIVEIDGVGVGDGTPGTTTRAVYERFRQRTTAV